MLLAMSRHRVPSHSRHEESKRVLTTLRVVGLAIVLAMSQGATRLTHRGNAGV
jgi:hypothetical protein